MKNKKKNRPLAQIRRPICARVLTVICSHFLPKSGHQSQTDHQTLSEDSRRRRRPYEHKKNPTLRGTHCIERRHRAKWLVYRESNHRRHRRTPRDTNKESCWRIHSIAVLWAFLSFLLPCETTPFEDCVHTLSQSTEEKLPESWRSRNRRGLFWLFAFFSSIVSIYHFEIEKKKRPGRERERETITLHYIRATYYWHRPPDPIRFAYQCLQ